MVLTLMVSSNLAHYQNVFAVVGAGYIVAELAGVLNALGVKTHLFVRKHAPLRSFDPPTSIRW